MLLPQLCSSTCGFRCRCRCCCRWLPIVFNIFCIYLQFCLFLYFLLYPCLCFVILGLFLYYLHNSARTSNSRRLFTTPSLALLHLRLVEGDGRYTLLIGTYRRLNVLDHNRENCTSAMLSFISGIYSRVPSILCFGGTYCSSGDEL